MTETDPSIWEKKDKRIATMNAFSNSTNFISACINAGIYQPKSVDDAFEAINKYMDLIYKKIYGEEVKEEEKKPYHCQQCNKEVTERVKEYCDEYFKGETYCIDCQEKIRKKS
jgi:hypothetical protein